MIRLITGFTSYNGRLISPKDGPVSLPEAAERNLVKRGVAEYAGDMPAIAPGTDVPLAPAFPMGDDAAELPPVPAKPDELAQPDEIDEAETVEEEVNAADLTVAQLKDIAAQMGIDTKGLRTKAALLEAIAAAKPPDPQVIV